MCLGGLGTLAFIIGLLLKLKYWERVLSMVVLLVVVRAPTAKVGGLECSA